MYCLPQQVLHRCMFPVPQANIYPTMQYVTPNPFHLLFPIQSSVAVDVMPGEYDPGHCCLPQQPLHRCMFPQANIYPTMQSVTNPYEASVDGIR